MSAAAVTANAASLANANGAISANTVTLTVPQLDNTGGQITAQQLSLSAANLTNERGSLTQLGSGVMSVGVSGTLDNANGGVIQTNSTDLTLAPATLNNSGGTITHAGTGTLTIDADSGTGTVTNAGGSIVSNGATMLSAAGVDNTGGTISAQAGFAATVTGALNNTRGRLASNANLSVSSGGALTNASGTIVAAGDGALRATTLTNGGSITAGRDLHTTVTGTLDNSGGTLTAQAVTTAAASFKNTSGIVSGDTLSFTIAQLDNSGGQIIANQLSLSAANLTNQHGTLTQFGTGTISLGVSGTLDNSLGGVIQTNSTDLTLAPAALNNNGGTITHAGTGTLTIDAAAGTGAVTNVAGSIVSNGLTTLSSGSLDNTGGAIDGQTGLVASVSGALNNTRGQLASNADLSVSSGGALTNASGVIAATGGGTVQAAALTNSGSITAAQDLNATIAGMLDNSGGTLSGQTVTSAAASFKNAGGTVSGNALSLTAAQFDNSNGRIIANQLALTSTNLTNAHGTLTQLGSGAIGVNVSGVFDNSNGGVLQTNSTDLTLAPATLDNDGGTITHAGTGTLTIDPSNGAGSFTNVGGRIVSNGRASVLAGSFDNTGGVLASQGVLSSVVQSVLNNTNGRLSSGTALSASSGGALRNSGGIIGAGGAVAGSTLSLSASSIDNSGGAITNAGTGAMTINGGSQITNTNAGNVTGMGSISGNGDVTLNATSVVNTQGGQLSGANLQIAAGNLNNSGGAIGNVANTTGDVGITTSSLTGTSGWINASRNLSITTSLLSGGGSYSAVGDLTLNLQGSFATSPNYSFGAGHNLTFTLPGTFSNGGRLAAAGGLNINASDVVNSGTLAAAGLLSTHSNTLTNTGTIVGGSVSLNATQTLSNLGTSALIGATDSAGKLELLAPDIENRDDTTAFDAQAMTAIYGLGQVVLAGGKDANGNYTNAGLVRNQSGLIQSGGDMLIAANQVTNTRRAMSTTGFTSSVDPNLLAGLGISLSGCVAVHMEACSGQNVGWVNPSDVDPSQIGGVYTDPPHGGQWNSGYQYTTYTGVALANTVASISPQSQIIAGGNLNASSVGTFQNYWSQVAAAGNIAMPAALDQDSWRGQSAPQVQVTYSGEYHYNNYDNSEHNWQLPFGDAPFVGSIPGGYTQAAPADVRTYALPGYESSFTAGGTLSGTGVTLNNTAGNAGVTPLGLLPGQSVSGVGAGSVGGTISAGSSGRAVGASRVNGAIVSTGGLPASTVAVHGGQVANSGLANFNDPVIASATAVTVLNNISVPQGGLFKRDTAPNATYLIETNPAFTNQQQWLSSDYYFQQMGMDPGRLQLRLGDGFYEQKLVQDQIMSMTGKAVLTNYASTQDEFKSLMTSGAELARSLDLAPGTGLSPQQVSQLTSNVVIMQSQIVDGERVLVPVVYLAKASQENMGNGPVIAATNIDLQNAKSVTNSGTIKAANDFSISGQSIDSSFGTLQAGGQMSLVTAGDVNLTSATVKAGSLALQAGGNLVLDTAVKTLDQVSASGATRISSTLGPTASIDVVGNAAIVTGGNFVQNAGNLSVGGALGMNIGGNWTLGVQETGETKVVARANGVSDTHVVGDTGSSVKVGGVSAIAVGGDLTATGANINLGGGGTIAAGGNVTLQAAKATSTVDSNSSGSDHHGSYAETLHTVDDKLTGTTLQSGDSLAIVAGKDIAVNGSTVSLDKGNATLAAAGNVEIGAVTETHELNSHETHSHSGVLSGTSVASGIDQTSTLSQGSTISADGVTIASGKDVTISGSNVVGTNDVTLKAAHDVKITTSQDTAQSSTYYDKKESGLLSNGGLSVSVGSRSMSDKQQSASMTNIGSMVGALNGDLTVSAGNDLHATGSVLHAGNDVGLAGKTVTIDSAYDTASQAEQQQFRQAGLTIGITSPVIAAIQTASQMASASRRAHGDARLTALAAATTGLAAKNAYDATGGGDPATAAKGVGINISLGASKSDSQSQAQSSTAVGSTVSAGGNVTIAAAGAGNDSNINVVGSTISAGKDAALLAEGTVNLQAAQSTSSQHSTNSGGSAGIGVSIAFGGSQNGIAFTAGVSGSRGHADGDSVEWTNTHVAAGDTLTIQSGGDTNVKGAVVSGKQVVADIGGNLNVESLQNFDHFDSKQQSAGVSVSVCVPPICYGGSSVSANVSHQKMRSDYASVGEQSGIQAGDGGFQINVKGNTDLKGGVIASSDKAIQDAANSLTTATLTYSDIQNHASYDASQVGISGGYGGSIGKDQKGTATNVNPVSGTTLPSAGGLSMAPPVALRASGDASSTTRSGISGGAIEITDGDKEQQLTGKSAAEAVASINRDTSNTGGTLAPIFDKNKVQAGFDITSQFINQVGTFVANRAAEADAAKKAANDPSLTPEQRAAAQQRADELNANWGPGGTYRQLLTALSVAAGGNVTGGVGQFAQNATVAYLQELGTNEVKRIADSLGNEDARAALHAIVGCAGAAATGQSCGAGAMGAAASSVLGTLLGPTDGMSAQEKQARENLVTSIVAGISSASGANAATATDAAQIEAENNQLAPPPFPSGPSPYPSGSPLPPFKLPGYHGEQAQKGDGVIADPATELDPSAKAGPLVSPLPSPGKISDWITSIVPDHIKGLVDYVISSVGGNNDRLPIPETVTADNGLQVVSNPKHTPGMPGNRSNAGTEPANSLDLFNSSIPGGNDTRYAIDSNGNINRFSSDGNGVYHWTGSSGDERASLNVSKIPIDVRRSLGFKGK
jgi:filamentous hemagglutinin